MNALTVRHWRTGLSRIVTVLALGIVLMGSSASGVSAQPAQLRLWSLPGLFPAFSLSISDYVVRCQPANSVQLFVSAPGGTAVSVDGAEPRTGLFTRAVNLHDGQSFQISVSNSGQTTTHFVRCLPYNFPNFSATRTGATQAEWYVLTPSAWISPPFTSAQYLAIFDNNGVPVWWEKVDGFSPPRDAKILPNGDVIWMHAAGAEEHELDGSLVRTIASIGGTQNQHDIQRLPNGDYVMGQTIARTGVDMTSCGGLKNGRFVDFELQVLTPTGDLVWSWRASDHIPLSEFGMNWQWYCSHGGDVYHWNAVEPVGGDFVISFRHLNAVYRINGTTGDIEWKLGGTPRPESLTIVGDPLTNQGSFDGQHDARILPDGSLTVFDNGTSVKRPPRDVRFAIDTNARTATLLEAVSDPAASYAGCCGSTRKLTGGDWVTSWGDSGYVTEQASNGAMIFEISFSSKVFSYRANPVLPGLISASELRAGMDAQHPRENP